MLTLFQSTHPRGVRRCCVLYAVFGIFNFNPRTHEGCDVVAFFMLSLVYSISIHAPTRGATLAASSFLPQAGRFQSTHPRGVRRGLQLYLCQGFFISIHAPTRGATKYPVLLFLFSSAFQSTHPRGVRLIVIGFLVFVSVFQSTHPRGVRHDYLSSHQIAVEFQSTHPRGVRLKSS